LLDEIKVMDETEAIELRVASNWHLWRVAANLHAQQDTETGNGNGNRKKG